MGGQACVLYGGAEFSRDTDLVVLGDSANLRQLQAALDELRAERIAVPPFESKYLEMGLAVHFRCSHPEADRMRVDVMSKLRGVDDFTLLWARRTTLSTEQGEIDLLSLPDLVQAKKTQRDKDWPMIARLIEANYIENQPAPTPTQVRFWLKELRSPTTLLEVAERFPTETVSSKSARPLLVHAIGRDAVALSHSLRAEEDAERDADRRYWLPLKQELERLRLAERLP